MERKVGEIFEYNGEWYQCLKSPDGSCKHCDMSFGGKCPIPIKECTESGRNDRSYIIFKKLEKVGEPIRVAGKLYQKIKTIYITCDYCSFYNEASRDCELRDDTCFGNEMFVEIKQNKEDMEEKKLNLKEFDLEAAKAGKPVCTRDGRKARIISFDRHGEDCPIIALVVDSKNAECEEVIDYTLDGICNENIINHNKYDLMMFTRKKEGWVNVYKSYNVGKKTPCIASIYPTKEEAKKSSVVGLDYVDTVKIEWEE
nr:MAG TPA: hypothetical protein [Caudoviricetes sp.]